MGELIKSEHIFLEMDRRDWQALKQKYAGWKPRYGDYKDEVLKLYDERHLSMRQVTEILGCNRKTVQYWVNKLDLNRSYTYRNPPLLDYTDHDKQMLALAIDLEGSISMPNYKSIQVVIAIGNTNREILIFIHKIAKMGRVRFGEPARSKNHHDKWLWIINSIPEAKAFLEQIEPYLIIKRERALLVLEYCDSRLMEDHREYTSRERELAKMVCVLNGGI